MYYQAHQEPGNSPAVTGFILSVSSIATLVFFIGVLSPITLGVSIAGTIVSRNGVKKVERAETRQHHDLARWGFWLGIVGVVLSALALAGWIVLIASGELETSDDEFDGEPVRALAVLTAAGLRLLG
jgi:hypothetical protein